MRRIQIIHVIAGTLVTVGTILSWTYSAWWNLLPLFVGVNLFQFGFSRWCLMETFLAKLGIGEP